jgi:cytochrome c
MDGFEFNKIVAAILIALLVVKGADLISDHLVHPIMLKENVFQIEGVSPSLQAGGATTENKGPGPLEPLLASASVEKGANVFKKCTSCHTIDKGGPNRVGPNLYGVVGAPVGKHPGYTYSSAMEKKGGDWTIDALNTYLYLPRDTVPGTKMSFVGIKDNQERADLIAYLNKQSDQPKPLPVAAPVPPAPVPTPVVPAPAPPEKPVVVPTPVAAPLVPPAAAVAPVPVIKPVVALTPTAAPAPVVTPAVAVTAPVVKPAVVPTPAPAIASAVPAAAPTPVPPAKPVVAPAPVVPTPAVAVMPAPVVKPAVIPTPASTIASAVPAVAPAPAPPVTPPVPAPVVKPMPAPTPVAPPPAIPTK